MEEYLTYNEILKVFTAIEDKVYSRFLAIEFVKDLINQSKNDKDKFSHYNIILLRLIRNL